MRGQAKTTWSYAPKFTPAAWAIAVAWLCHVPYAQFAFVAATVYQPKTLPLRATAPRDSSAKKFATLPALLNMIPFAALGLTGWRVSFEKFRRMTATFTGVAAAAMARSAGTSWGSIGALVWPLEPGSSATSTPLASWWNVWPPER